MRCQKHVICCTLHEITVVIRVLCYCTPVCVFRIYLGELNVDVFLDEMGRVYDPLAYETISKPKIIS